MAQTVLIIDDESHIRLLYTEELRQQGFVAVASDGQEDPLILMEKHKPDLIILDIKLGAVSGLDLLQEIRRKQATLPVILCTAYDSFRCDLKSIAADAYIVKSYDSSELLDTVRKLLSADTQA